MTIRDFRDLTVYQRSKDLLPLVAEVCDKLQKTHRELAKNLLKTACQIGPQIAEGYGKKSSANEFRRYLEMAIGSTDEMIAHLEQVLILAKSVDEKSVNKLIQEYEVTVKQLQVLKRNWR